jgi:23S rRNA (uracil1939-C5)-methyltransferase
MPQNNVLDSIRILDIDRLSYGPYGIGRNSGKAVMVPYTAPGDRVAVRIRESRRRYDVGEITRVIAPSPLRQTPPCPYFTACGGCSWQHLRYEAQLRAKQQSVADALQRIGKFADFELKPIVSAPDEYHYRRRIRLQVGTNNTLGFFGTGSHELVEIGSCLIADERLNQAIDVLRHWIRRLRTAVEYVEIVAGDQPAEVVAVIGAATSLASADESNCEDLTRETETIHGLILSGENWRRTWGQTAITIALNAGLGLTVDADVFTQVNAAGNRQMLQTLLTAARFNRSDRVLELYCGAGNFTLPIAQQASEVIAVEGDRSAIRHGKLNAQKNDLPNIRWTCAPVPRAVAELRRRREEFTKIVLDPPRAGAKEIAASLPDLNASRIVYISCNPTTLARDLAELARRGYRLETVQPFDFFPQTFHVETLAVIDR